MTVIRHTLPLPQIAAIAVLLLASLQAGHGVQTATEWWNGKAATGDWLGVRESLRDRGIVVFGSWKASFFGLTNGGLDSPRGAFDEEVTLGVRLDFDALAGIEGLTAEGSVRYRDGRNVNNYVGASSTFSPTRYQSGQQWRLMPFFVTYTTPEMFGVKNFLTLSGGWQNAYTFFADQPAAKLFTSNAIGATKGIGGVDGFPWSSSYAAWGGFVKVKPVSWLYAMAGLYMAIPEASQRGNHGLDFAGYGPDPGRNGLYFIAETGVTPKVGPAALPGKYSFGAIGWGIESRTFEGERHDGKCTFYWQAEQMAFREKAGAEEGLSAFAFANYAPEDVNALPFYLHAGLVYEGLLPGRDHDRMGVAFAVGNYSFDKILAEDHAGVSVHQTYEAVIEVDYRMQLTHFVFLQPFWQYVVRPNGTGLVSNANILGLHLGVDF